MRFPSRSRVRDGLFLAPHSTGAGPSVEEQSWPGACHSALRRVSAPSAASAAEAPSVRSPQRRPLPRAQFALTWSLVGPKPESARNPLFPVSFQMPQRDRDSPSGREPSVQPVLRRKRSSSPAHDTAGLGHSSAKEPPMQAEACPAQHPTLSNSTT